MSDEDNLEGPEGQTDTQAPPEPTDPLEAAKERIRRAEERAKKAERKAAFMELRARSPHVKEEDFEILKHVPVEKWDGVASRFTPPPAETKLETKPEETPEVAAAQRFAQAAGGIAPTTPQPMSRRELDARLRTRNITLDEYRRLYQENLLPGR